MLKRKNRIVPYNGLLLFSAIITFLFYTFNLYMSSQGNANFGVEVRTGGYEEQITTVIVYVFLFFLLFLLMVFAFHVWLNDQNNRTTLDLSKESTIVNDSIEQMQRALTVSKDDYVRLSSYMAHEQKNLLAILRAKIQLKEDNELLSEVDKMSEALDDVLTMTASEDMYRTEAVDITILCAEVVDEYRKIYSNIHFHFEEENHPIILGRGLWLYRAVSNLIENAIKYGENSLIEVVLSVEKGSIILKVKDGGKGISAKEQQRIFDNYYRIDKIKTDGYGIGLNLVRHVCTLCNGFFLAESQENQGSTFYMIFPEYSEEVQEGREEDEAFFNAN